MRGYKIQGNPRSSIGVVKIPHRRLPLWYEKTIHVDKCSMILIAYMLPLVILILAMQLCVRPWYLSFFFLGMKETALNPGTQFLWAGSTYLSSLVMLSIWCGIALGQDHDTC